MNRPRPSTLLTRFFREPLLHFLIIGAGLFLLFGWRGDPASLQSGQFGPQSNKIIVAQEKIDQLVAAFTRTWMRPPTEGEVKGLIEDFIRDEIYYREAIAIGLDRGDALIRRKLRQKMEFILEDVAAQAEPTEEDLEAFLDKHADKYRIDPQISFRQVYIHAERRGQSAEDYARLALDQLNRGADPGSAGDWFLLDPKTELSPLWEIGRQYGVAFSRRLLELAPGRWTGPVRSGYGLHLVFIEERVEGRMPELKDVREMLKRDWAVALKKELKDAAYARIKERYTVEFEKPEGKAESGVAEARTINLNKIRNPNTEIRNTSK